MRLGFCTEEPAQKRWQGMGGKAGNMFISHLEWKNRCNRERSRYRRFAPALRAFGFASSSLNKCATEAAGRTFPASYFVKARGPPPRSSPGLFLCEVKPLPNRSNLIRSDSWIRISCVRHNASPNLRGVSRHYPTIMVTVLAY